MRVKRFACDCFESKLDCDLQSEHKRVAVLAEAARLDDVLDVGLHGELLGDLDDVARVEHGLQGTGGTLLLTLRVRLAEAADLP